MKILILFAWVLFMPVMFAVSELLAEMARRKWPRFFIEPDIEIAIKNLDQRLSKIEQSTPNHN